MCYSGATRPLWKPLRPPPATAMILSRRRPPPTYLVNAQPNLPPIPLPLGGGGGGTPNSPENIFSHCLPSQQRTGFIVSMSTLHRLGFLQQSLATVLKLDCLTLSQTW